MKYGGHLVVLFVGILTVFVAGPLSIAAEEQTSLSGMMVTLSSGTVRYLDAGGTGVPVLLLHPANIRLWQYQIPAFAKAGYRVIAIDSRDHTAGLPPEPLGSPKSVERLEELIVRLGLTRFHIVGTGRDGPLALQYARAHPKKVRSVVMSGTLGGLTDPSVLELDQSLRPALFNELPDTFRDLSPSYRAAHPEGTKRWQQLEETGEAEVALPPRPVAGASLSTPDPLTIERLEAWQLPTMLITGDADWYTPASMMRIFVSHLKHGEGAVIAESAHETYWENPEQYNRTVLRFIQKY